MAGVTTNSVHPGVVNTEIFGKEGWRIVNLPAILAAWIMAKVTFLLTFGLFYDNRM